MVRDPGERKPSLERVKYHIWVQINSQTPKTLGHFGRIDHAKGQAESLAAHKGMTAWLEWTDPRTGEHFQYNPLTRATTERDPKTD